MEKEIEYKGEIYRLLSPSDLERINSEKRNNTPKPPLCRMINEMSSYTCLKCSSSSFKDGFLRLFGERLCVNEECENSNKRFKKIN